MTFTDTVEQVRSLVGYPLAIEVSPTGGGSSVMHLLETLDRMWCEGNDIVHLPFRDGEGGLSLKSSSFVESAWEPQPVADDFSRLRIRLGGLEVRLYRV